MENSGKTKKITCGGDVTKACPLVHEECGGASPTPPLHNVGIAYQKIVRDRKAILDEEGNLFGDFWSKIDIDLKKAVVREISLNEAKKIIVEYEWLGCLPAVNWKAFGIFFEETLGGAVVFGPEYSENLGVWDKYGYTGKMILLSRGACVHWTPPNTGSKLIMRAIKMLPEKYKVVTCTVDSLAGEIGTIYQACNFIYVGSMRASNPRKGGATRQSWLIGGKLYGSRSMRAKIGTQKISEVLKYFPDAKIVTQVSKGRYFHFRGNKDENESNLESIKHLIKPYPKRDKPLLQTSP